MRSWVFRNRRRLEVIYGTPGRSRPLTEPARGRSETPPTTPRAEDGPAARILAYELIPSPRRPLRRAG